MSTRRHTSTRPPSYTAYKTDGCRCYACAAAKSAYARERERAILNGTWQPFAEAQPVRDHFAMLAAHGIGWRRASRLAGISTGTTAKILYGVPLRGRPPAAKVRTETAAAILAVRPAPEAPADYAVVDATGYRRRLQALVALGYPQGYLASELGIRPSNFHIRTERVLARHARAARDLYDRLWNQNPADSGVTVIGATRARRYAAAYGWPPPLAWDDDTIDDPDAQPDLGGQVRRQDALAEDAAFIARTTGADLDQIAARLGVTRNYLDKIRERQTAAA